MNKRTSLFIADDHPIFRCGLRDTVEKKAQQFEILGEAEEGEAAWERIIELEPDIALLDIDMPKVNGLELAAKLREAGFLFNIDRPFDSRTPP